MGYAYTACMLNSCHRHIYAVFVPLANLLLPKDLTIQNLFIFTATGVVPCGGRKTSPCTS